MTIVPVIDLLDGVVVRGVAGRRDQYRPVESCLTDSADALTVARAFREQLALDELYVADLDAIVHARPNLALLHRLISDGFRLWVDAGIRVASDAEPLADVGAATIIAGLETLAGPEQLELLCERFGPDRIAFSLDLMGGRPLRSLDTAQSTIDAPERRPKDEPLKTDDLQPSTHWETEDPLQIGRRAADTGIGAMIVLDLAGVGLSAGVPTAALCRRLHADRPKLRVLTGGGVRNAADLETLQRNGVDGVLIASALHSGALGRTDIERFCVE